MSEPVKYDYEIRHLEYRVFIAVFLENGLLLEQADYQVITAIKLFTHQSSVKEVNRRAQTNSKKKTCAANVGLAQIIIIAQRITFDLNPLALEIDF